VFRRRRNTQDEQPVADAATETDTNPEEDAVPAGQEGIPAAGPGPRPAGPWDVSEVDDPAEGGRLPLGAMWLPGVEGMELRVEVDEQAGRIMAVTVVLEESTLQIQPFAAPRTSGIWDEIRADIAASVREQGGATTERAGALGTELLAEIPVQLSDGTQAVQAARFLGVDGPRWFLRGVVTGRAYDDPVAAEPLEGLFRGVVVVRGDQPMPRGELLELTLPVEDSAMPGEEPPREAGDERPSLQPFERGPEITEVR
jgi:hypothetical protein